MDKDEARRAIRSILDINPRAPDHIWGFAIGRLFWIIQSFGSSSPPTIWGWISTTPDGVTIHGLRRVSLILRLATAIGALGVIGYFIAIGSLSALGWLALLIPAVWIPRWTDALWIADSDRMMGKLAWAVGAQVPMSARSPAPRKRPIPRLPEADQETAATMRLIVNGDALPNGPTRGDLEEQVAKMSEDEFLIIERGENQFIQALRVENGLVIEHRCGGLDIHFRASELLRSEDALTVLEHYLATAEAHPHLDWERIKL